MPADYGLNGDIVNVRNVLIAVLESADSNSGGTGGAAAPSDWLSERVQQLHIALTPLRQHCKKPPGQLWAPPLVSQDIIPRAVQLLHRITTDYQTSATGHVGSGQQQAQVSESARRAARGRNSDALAPATIPQLPLPVPPGAAMVVAVLTYIPASLLRVVSEYQSSVLGCLAGSDPPQSEPDRSLRALLDQLLSLPALTALAAGVRWLMAEAQALVQLEARAASDGRRPVVEACDEADRPHINISRNVTSMTPSILAVASAALRDFLAAPTTILRRTSSAAAAAATTGPRLLQLLRDLHTSGLVAALCGAVVAVETSLRPLFVASPKDAAVCASACYQALVMVANLGCAIGDIGQTRAAALTLLQLPEVRWLRLTALEQLAASAPQLPGPATIAAGDADAATSLRRVQSRRDTGEGRAGAATPAASTSAVAASSASTSSSASSPTSAAPGAGAAFGAPARWSMLDRKALSLFDESHGASLASAHEAIASAFLAPLPAVVASSEASQHLPQPRQRFAALAAAACRAMVVEAEADSQQKRELESWREQGTSEGGGDRDGRGPAGAKLQLLAQVGGVAICAADAVFNAGSGAGGGARPLEAEAETSLPDVLEAQSWALRALAGNAAEVAVCGDGFTKVLQFLAACLQRFATCRPATKEQLTRRLVLMQLPASLDCLLRRALSQRQPGATGLEKQEALLLMVAQLVLQDFMERIAMERQTQDQPPPPVWLQAATAAAAGSDGSGGSSSGGGGGKPRRPSPQDDVGLLITLAKLAQRDAAAAKAATAAAVAAPSSASLCGGPSALAPRLVATNLISSYAICSFLSKAQGQQGSAAPSSQGAASSSGAEAQVGGDVGAWQAAAGGRFAVALREGVAVLVRATIPLVEALLADDAPAGWLREWRDPATGEMSDATANMETALAGCVFVAAMVLPPEETLALEPQRLLTLATRRLQEAATATTASARARDGSAAPAAPGRSALGRGGSSEGAEKQAGVCGATLNYTALALSCLAAHEGLVGTVAGWLRGDAHGGAAGSSSQSRQQQQQQLDVEALAAAMRHWNDDAADQVMSLRKLAKGMGGEGAGGGGDRAAVAQRLIMNVARAALARQGFSPDMPAFCPRDSGGSGSSSKGSTGSGNTRDSTGGAAPLRVPRVLRLCCNPRCDNFAGPAENTLRLQVCGGCRVVRYCGPGCQRQHWLKGGHKQQCQVVRAAEGRAGTAEADDG